MLKASYLPGSSESLSPVLVRFMPACGLTNFNNTIHMHALNKHAADSGLKELNARGGSRREKMFKAGTQYKSYDLVPL